MRNVIVVAAIAVALGIAGLAFVALDQALAAPRVVVSTLLVGAVLSSLSFVALFSLVMLARSDRRIEDLEERSFEDAPTNPAAVRSYELSTSPAWTMRETVRGKFAPFAVFALMLAIAAPATLTGCGDNELPGTDAMYTTPHPIDGAGACCALHFDRVIEACFDVLAELHPVPPGWCRNLDCDDGRSFEICCDETHPEVCQ